MLSFGAIATEPGEMSITKSENVEFNKILNKTSHTPIYSITSKRGTFSKSLNRDGIEFLSYDPQNQRDALYVYAEIDEILKEFGDIEGSTKIQHALEAGHTVILETNSYDVTSLNRFIELLSIDAYEFTNSDVLISLELDASGKLTTAPVQLTELALKLGMPYELTTEYRIRMIDSKKAKTKTPVASQSTYTRDIHKRMVDYSYQDNPPTTINVGHGHYWRLKKNYVVVDIWERRHRSSDRFSNDPYREECVVAWRGTDSSDARDIAEDISSQVRSTIHLMGTPTGNNGAQGFVRRINELSEFIEDDLEEAGCVKITTVGHSLGAALAQIHAFKLQYSNIFTPNIIFAYNSPNFANVQMRNTFRANAAALGMDFNIYNRGNDVVVNSVPTGLRRFGHTPLSFTSVRDVTYVGTKVTNNSFGNHGLDLWWTNP
jgi:hypothetical protein